MSEEDPYGGGDDDFDASQYPTLYWGDNDDEPPMYWVSYMQQLLVDSGEDPQGVDGFFGPHTNAAVQSFQRSHGCDPDGVVGNQTWAAFFGKTAPKGVNRANPHGGGGGGGGGGVHPDDIGDQRIYFSTSVYYSTDADCIATELVNTHAHIPSGETIAEVYVYEPDGSEYYYERFVAPNDMDPVSYFQMVTHPLTVGDVSGTFTAKVILDSGKGQTREISFEPVRHIEIDEEQTNF